MRLPLEGVTVIDLSHALAGPFCSTMLADFGARVIKLEPRGAGDIARAWGTPMPGGDYLWRVNDHEKTRREIARHSRLDAEAYDEYGRAMVEMGRFAKPILAMTPPDPTKLGPRGLFELLGMGRRFRGMRSHDRINQVQLLTMSAVDFLDQWFETDVLKATMAASGIIGTFLGVRSPGTAYVLLHHYMGEIDGAFRSWGLSRGGTGAVSNAIASAGREQGAEIRTEAAVARILTKNGRATGVVLENGDEIDASVVVSSVDPNLTFLKLMDARELPAGGMKVDDPAKLLKWLDADRAMVEIANAEELERKRSALTVLLRQWIGYV